MELKSVSKTKFRRVRQTLSLLIVIVMSMTIMISLNLSGLNFFTKTRLASKVDYPPNLKHAGTARSLKVNPVNSKHTIANHRLSGTIVSIDDRLNFAEATDKKAEATSEEKYKV